MRIRVPLMVQDPDLARLPTDRPVEEWLGLDEDHYLDGPVTPRVAVIDLHPTTEDLQPGAVFQPPHGDRKLGRYDVHKDDLTSPHFIQVSVFGTVMRTVYMYEEQDTLGRKVRWGFDGPQLLVVPRAGWLANAYYERRSRSLQFFSFHAHGKLVHTSLSRDIVAHETAHALVDGIAPDLYDALDPQSLALHEAVADLTAVLIAFRSHRLRDDVLAKTKGSIGESNAFSSIGEQFGRAIDPSGQVGWLRNLLNTATLDPQGNPADEPEAHALSEVLTGALYSFLVELHEHYLGAYAQETGKPKAEVAGLALFTASEQFKRMILRGLDYLPPGEITFADYGRAILAADQASFPDDRWRRLIRAQLVQRGIVAREQELDVTTNVEHDGVAAADLQALVDSPWSAYRFTAANRDLLGIPRGAQVEVLPRIVVDKRFERPGLRARVTVDTEGLPPVKELLFKVRWSRTEPNPRDLGAPRRRIQTGTTLVIDWDRKLVRSCLGPLHLEERRPARDTSLRRLMQGGRLQLSSPDDPKAVQQTLGTGVEGVVTRGILRVHGTARLLHVARGADDD